MIDHCNRWLLGFAAAYLALLPTNTATLVRSVAFGGSVVLALVVLGLARRHDPADVPSPGWPVLAALGAWCLWSMLSLAWSVDPAYSQTQLEREIGDSVSVMLVFYIAARDARSFRTLAAAALASFAALAALAIAIDFFTGSWDAGRYHHGVGPWSTLSVLVAPLLFALVAPPPIGFANGARSIVAGLALVAMLVVTDRMTDNRIVWIALAAVFGVASLAAALRWPRTFVRTPMRWIGPVVAMLVVLGIAFTDAVRERAVGTGTAATSVAASLERDPRLLLWDRIRVKIEERPWVGYGFGRRVLADELAAELHDPLLAHAHNAFASQWLQTGLVGMLLFVALLLALLHRFARFLASRDDALAFVGVVGIALIAGFVVKNMTDDFLFRSNAKEFWALGAMLLGYGTRREQAVKLALGAAPGALPGRVDEPVAPSARAQAVELVDT